jgi:mono/diheme cytochrome c family protein
MNRYSLIAFVALLVVVAALPVYALLEPNRMERAQRAFYDEYAADGVLTYIESCADCHGPMGEGIGAVPPLNNPGLAEADRWILYDTIARAPHGTAMSAWHVGEGGTLSGYEVEGLVTLIQSGEWMRVGALTLPGPMPLPTPAPFAELMALEPSEEMDPHECRACHEEPAVHAERFGLDCARCHTLQAWKPALLLRHVFFLDHGEEGQVACQTCHMDTYAENTCYECHDHDPAEMQAAHAREDITDYEDCAKCHPTGQQGEAAKLGYGRSGEANRGQPVGGGLEPDDETAASPTGH